jgi:Skp family chaperone for outer membrane proteins
MSEPRLPNFALLESELAQYRAAEAALQAELAQRDQRLERMAEEQAVLTEALTDATSQATEYRAQASAWKKEADNLHATAKAFKAEVGALRFELANATKELRAVHGSTAWSIVQLLWRARTLLVPHGGLRDRVLWRLLVTYRHASTRRSLNSRPDVPKQPL